MRILFLPLALAALVAVPANAASRNFGITGFTKIRVSGPYKITLATGVAPFARASGSAAALDRVAIEVRDDTLIVQSNPSWGGYPGSDPGPVEVALGTHDLNQVSLIGAGSLTIDRVKSQRFRLIIQGSGASDIADIAVDQFDVSLEGTANARVAGKAGKFVAQVRGVSLLDAKSLATPSADINVDGSATVDANVTDVARVNGWGPATVRLAGRPSCTVKVQGSTTVSGCRATQ